jgi:hypothetical protein
MFLIKTQNKEIIMNIKRILFLLLITGLLLSCVDATNESSGCDFSNTPKFYDIQNITLNNLIYEDDVSNLYSWYKAKKIQLGQIIDAKKYVIEISAESNFTLTKNKKHYYFNLSPIQSAVACSPAPPKTYEIISMLKITSNEDFNENYPAGSDLSALFIIKDVLGEGVNSDYYKYYNTIFTVNEFVKVSPPGMQRIHMMLTIAPSLSKIHNFKVEYMHTSGEYFDKYPEQVMFQ